MESGAVCTGSSGCSAKKAEVKDTSRRETKLCPVRLATPACLLLSYPLPNGHFFFSASQPETENELFFF